MNKEYLKEKVFERIDNEKEKSIEFLRSLIRLPSPTGTATLAQELVLQKLQSMGFKINKFDGNIDLVKKFDDYCPLPDGEKIDENAYNLVGIKKGRGKGRSLMIFSHIDTELPEQHTKSKNVYKGEIIDGRLYGLGAADAKSGIAIMLLAVENVLREVPDIEGDLILMSILGKKGGSAGTLTAITKGYKADSGIYIHGAETGNGFKEIKCYSMGIIDFKIKVKGKKGHPIDELDDSEVNAITKGLKVINALIEWDKRRRQSLRFKSGEFKGQPKTKLDICVAKGGTCVGKDPLNFEVQCRLFFGVGETISYVMKELRTFIKKYLSNDEWLTKNPPEIEYMNLRATPSSTGKDADIIKTIEKNIDYVKGYKDFIYQYHGASDIRFPNLYGNTTTVGIGPRCGGLFGYEWADWVDIEDYIDGIKILASIIIDWCIM